MQNTVNVLPTFITNEIHIGSAIGNDATTSQEPDRHASPASSGSDIPQEWVTNLKDQRPRSNTAKPKSDLWQSYNIGLPPVGQQNTVTQWLCVLHVTWQSCIFSCLLCKTVSKL